MMLNRIRKLIYLVILGCLLNSCATKFSFHKRRYMSGIYLSHNNKQLSAKQHTNFVAGDHWTVSSMDDAKEQILLDKLDGPAAHFVHHATSPVYLHKKPRVQQPVVRNRHPKTLAPGHIAKKHGSFIHYWSYEEQKKDILSAILLAFTVIGVLGSLYVVFIFLALTYTAIGFMQFIFLLVAFIFVALLAFLLFRSL